MPFKSKAQMGLFFAKEKRGELPKGKAEQWAHETPNIKKLPQYIHKGLDAARKAGKKGKKKEKGGKDRCPPGDKRKRA